jgi:hypothetical protein
MFRFQETVFTVVWNIKCKISLIPENFGEENASVTALEARTEFIKTVRNIFMRMNAVQMSLTRVTPVKNQI